MTRRKAYGERTSFLRSGIKGPYRSLSGRKFCFGVLLEDGIGPKETPEKLNLAAQLEPNEVAFSNLLIGRNGDGNHDVRQSRYGRRRKPQSCRIL
ncbi:MAG: hypothetical protein ACLRSW_13150 [Christensenellaceae bacterium]